MKLVKSFIPLPFSFDAPKLAEEAVKLPDSAWLPHPSGLEGNSAVPLISVGGAINDLFNGRMATTKWLAECPYHQQVLASFNEILGRSRLMKLAPGAEVAEHVDVDYHWLTRVRIHIPIITDPEVMFFCAGDRVHMKAGDCWIFNSWEAHRVVNNSGITRIHLVLDVSGSSRFWRTVREMEIYDHRTDLCELGERISFIPYEEGKLVTILTENHNVSPVMVPGELDALVKDLIADFDGNPVNDATAAEQYIKDLTDFAIDWRQGWLMFGSSKEGWRYYQTLLHDLSQKIMRRDNVVVKLKSNNLEVNGVIFKRIIGPALAVEVLNGMT